ncbi:MAG TPA: hypothetical protein VF057_04480, partial [Thermoanaerobaculia bacterium]
MDQPRITEREEQSTNRASRRCVLVHEDGGFTQPDLVLVRELIARGNEVELVVAPAISERMPASQRWASALRSYSESALAPSRGEIRLDQFSTPVHRAGSVTELVEKVASPQPARVIHFGSAKLAASIAVHAPVIQVWLDGHPETLRMESAIVPSNDARKLAVTRLQADWPHPRVLDRADVIPLHRWAREDQMAAATRAVVLILRALDQVADGEEMRDATRSAPLRTAAESVRVFGSAF